MRMILGCGLNTIIMENVPLVPVSLIVWWTIVRRLWRTLLNMLIAIMDPSPVSSAGYLISLEVLGVRAATPTGDGAFLCAVLHTWSAGTALVPYDICY